MATDFLVKNSNPDLTGQDNNFDVRLYMAKKSAGLTMDSQTGWRRPGAVTPDSYKPDEQTGVNATELGNLKLERSHHINSQKMPITANLKEITPWGTEIRNKTTMPVDITYGSKLVTVATGGGGLKVITLDSIGSIVPGDKLAIPLSSGNSAYVDVNKRVSSVSGNAITLDRALDEAPADGVGIKDFNHIDFMRGGDRLREFSMLAVISGDFDDVIAHFSPHVHSTGGNSNFPGGSPGNTDLSLAVVAQDEVVEGRPQPVLMYERWVP